MQSFYFSEITWFNCKIAFLEHINGFQAWLIRSSWCPGEEASLREEVHRLPSDKTALLPSERVSWHCSCLPPQLPLCLETNRQGTINHTSSSKSHKEHSAKVPGPYPLLSNSYTFRELHWRALAWRNISVTRITAAWTEPTSGYAGTRKLSRCVCSFGAPAP